MVYRYLTWFCATVLCTCLSHLLQMRNKYAFTHSVTSAAECDLNSPSYLRRHKIWFQFATRTPHTVYCIQSVPSTFSHTKIFTKKKKRYGATQPASMGDLEAWNLLNTFHFFTSTQMNCVYWDEPTVVKSVMWLRYGTEKLQFDSRHRCSLSPLQGAHPSPGPPSFLLNGYRELFPLASSGRGV